jgi:hypothetical protein
MSNPISQSVAINIPLEVNVHGYGSEAALDAAHSDTRGTRVVNSQRLFTSECHEVDERAPSAMRALNTREHLPLEPLQVQNQSVCHEGRIWSIISGAGDAITYIVSQIFIILAEIFRTLIEAFAPNDRIVCERYGNGITNGGGSCYMDSSLQWIRKLREGLLPAAIPPRQNAIGALQAPRDLLLRDMRDLFRTIEGPNGRNATAEEINHFRGFCIEHGFAPAAPENIYESWGQQDAVEFLNFILTQLEIPPVLYVQEVRHDLGVRINNIKDIEMNAHLLRLSPENVQDRTPFAALLRPNHENHTFRLANVDARDARRLPQAAQALFAADPAAAIPLMATETIKFRQGHCPPVLPIVVNKPANIKILPSYTLDIPLLENPRRFARYSLQAVVCHIGDAQAGHYYSYSVETPDGRTQYVQFDDSSVRLFPDPDNDPVRLGTTASDDLAKNGYIYGYRFEHFVEH